MIGLLSEFMYDGDAYANRKTVTVTYTPGFFDDKSVIGKPKKESKLKYYIFSIRWLWKNRKWDNTRQKFKRMSEDYEQYKQGKPCKYL